MTNTFSIPNTIFVAIITSAFLYWCFRDYRRSLVDKEFRKDLFIDVLVMLFFLYGMYNVEIGELLFGA